MGVTEGVLELDLTRGQYTSSRVGDLDSMPPAGGGLLGWPHVQEQTAFGAPLLGAGTFIAALRQKLHSKPLVCTSPCSQ